MKDKKDVDREKQKEEKCKYCRERYAKNKEVINKKNRESYYKYRDVRLLHKREYNYSEAGKRKNIRYLKKHPERIKARQRFNNAVRDGKITRPSICQNCGKPAFVEGHHYKGYDSEHVFDVIWLCFDCHVKADGLKIA